CNDGIAPRVPGVHGRWSGCRRAPATRGRCGRARADPHRARRSRGPPALEPARVPPEGRPGYARESPRHGLPAGGGRGPVGPDAGMPFGYPCHGYDMAPSTEGTLFDTLAGATDPKLVGFQIDTFHAFHGGGDPVALIAKYAGRVRSLHLKDMAKGKAQQPGAG